MYLPKTKRLHIMVGCDYSFLKLANKISDLLGGEVVGHDSGFELAYSNTIIGFFYSSFESDGELDFEEYSCDIDIELHGTPDTFEDDQIERVNTIIDFCRARFRIMVVEGLETVVDLQEPAYPVT